MRLVDYWRVSLKLRRKIQPCAGQTVSRLTNVRVFPLIVPSKRLTNERGVIGFAHTDRASVQRAGKLTDHTGRTLSLVDLGYNGIVNDLKCSSSTDWSSSPATAPNLLSLIIPRPTAGKIGISWLKLVFLGTRAQDAQREQDTR